jgi:hypothetical protein
MAYRRVNKFGARKVTVDGVTYDSAGEAALANEIALMIRAGELLYAQRQVSVPLFGLHGHEICVHRLDFVVTLPSGAVEVWEFKGFETPEWKLKRKLFESCYPSIPYRVRKTVRT